MTDIAVVNIDTGEHEMVEENIKLQRDDFVSVNTTLQ